MAMWIFGETWNNLMIQVFVHLIDFKQGTLYGVWNNLSGLRDSIINKRMHLQQLIQEEKLQLVLNDQVNIFTKKEVKIKNLSSLKQNLTINVFFL